MDTVISAVRLPNGAMVPLTEELLGLMEAGWTGQEVQRLIFVAWCADTYRLNEGWPAGLDHDGRLEALGVQIGDSFVAVKR